MNTGNQSALIASNLSRWRTASILPSLLPVVSSVAYRLVQTKTRYQTVSDETDVPWFIIAVIHERESSQSWLGNLANGDPWNKVTIHVPKGRGPFISWEDAAVDALTDCPPYIADWPDWTPGGALTALEEYNGLGYAMHNVPSPYIWASTNIYHSGKYIADGHYDPNAIDTQLGCAALIMQMSQIDTTIQFQGA